MNRDPYYLRRRNALIYRAFLAAQSPATPAQSPTHLAAQSPSRCPTMRLYAHLAQQFFLSEESIRKIIQSQRKMPQNTRGSVATDPQISSRAR